MRKLTVRFCIDGTQLEELEIEAPTGVSLKRLIKNAKKGLKRHFARRSTRKPRLGDRFSSVGKGGVTSRGDDDLPPAGLNSVATAQARSK